MQAMQMLAQASDNASQILSIWDFVLKGGPVMIPIGLASLVALAIVIERSVSLRRRRIIPDGLLQDVKARLADGAGAGKAQALERCTQDGSPLAQVLAAAIRRLGEPIERIEKHVEETGQRVVLKLRRYMRSLSMIASIATLLGLLGTITGMIQAFQTVAGSAEALGKTELLAKGIYEAMITTAAGLIVAIPTMVAYHWLSARIEQIVLEIDETAVAFVEGLNAPAATAAAAPPTAAATTAPATTTTPTASEGQASVCATAL